MFVTLHPEKQNMVVGRLSLSKKGEGEPAFAEIF
jgi:hypothetical protein